jgi:hypothetical protein
MYLPAELKPGIPFAVLKKAKLFELMAFISTITYMEVQE